jgi:hypothetical protein
MSDLEEKEAPMSIGAFYIYYLYLSIIYVSRDIDNVTFLVH